MDILMLLLEAKTTNKPENKYKHGIIGSVFGTLPIQWGGEGVKHSQFNRFMKSREKNKPLSDVAHQKNVDIMHKKFGLRRPVSASSPEGAPLHTPVSAKHGIAGSTIGGAGGRRRDAITLAHEMGHVSQTQSRGAKLHAGIVHASRVGPLAGAIAGGAMLNSENEKTRKRAPLVAGALASGEVANEMGANIRAYKGLRKGFKMKPGKAVGLLVKHMAKPQSTYLATPATVAGGVYAVKKYQDYKAKNASMKKGK